MANKVNYYSWIHELNKSAIMTKYMAEADLYRNSLNGFQISQNMKSYVNQFIDGARNKNHSGIMQRHNLNEARDRRRDEIERPIQGTTRAENISRELVRLMKDMDIPPESIAKRTDEILGVSETGANFRGAFSGMGSGWARSPSIRRELSLGADDQSDVGKSSMAELQKALGNASIDRANMVRDIVPTDIDGDGDADASDVKLDAHDWKMGNEGVARLPNFAFARQEGIPTSQEHPAPRFGSKEEAEAFVREMNRRQRGENSLMSSLDDILDQQKTSRQGTMGEMQTIAKILGGR